MGHETKVPLLICRPDATHVFNQAFSAVKYWKANRLEPVYVDVLDAITRRADFTFSDIRRLFGVKL